MKFNRAGAIALLLAIGGFVSIQFVPVRRVNPPVTGEVSAPPAAEAALRRSCYDCHSNETHWPWYGEIAPASWPIAREVARGRRELNFSQWGGYYPLTKHRKLEWIGRALREEKMPPWSYVAMHPGARLSDADRAAIERWVESAPASSSAEKSNKGNERTSK
ncbi:MAG: heme-binding domain-containing protein [Candidatus Binataceae bacterium]